MHSDHNRHAGGSEYLRKGVHSLGEVVDKVMGDSTSREASHNSCCFAILEACHMRSRCFEIPEAYHMRIYPLVVPDSSFVDAHMLRHADLAIEGRRFEQPRPGAEVVANNTCCFEEGMVHGGLAF